MHEKVDTMTYAHIEDSDKPKHEPSQTNICYEVPFHLRLLIHEPVHEKVDTMTYAPIEDSDKHKDEPSQSNICYATNE